MDFSKHNIWPCIDDLYIPKGWTFWYIGLVFIKKFHKGTHRIFSKNCRNFKKFWKFFSQFFPEKSPSLVNLWIFLHSTNFLSMNYCWKIKFPNQMKCIENFQKIFDKIFSLFVISSIFKSAIMSLDTLYEIVYP